MDQENPKERVQLDPGPGRFLQWVPPEFRTAKAFVALIIVFVLTEAFWEWLAKPGLGEVGRFLLSFVTFGSETVRDAAYQSAALDPYPVSSLALLGLLVQVPIAVFLMTGFGAGKVNAEIAEGESELEATRQEVLDTPRKLAELGQRLRDGDPTAQPEAEDLLRKNLQKSDAEHERQVAPLKKQIAKTSRQLRLARVTLLPLCLISLIGGAVINQAVLIRRVFLANVAICAPHMPEAQRNALMGRFAAMSKRIDYQSIQDEMISVAQSAGIRLRSEELW